MEDEEFIDVKINPIANNSSIFSNSCDNIETGNFILINKKCYKNFGKNFQKKGKLETSQLLITEIKNEVSTQIEIVEIKRKVLIEELEEPDDKDDKLVIDASKKCAFDFLMNKKKQSAAASKKIESDSEIIVLEENSEHTQSANESPLPSNLQTNAKNSPVTYQFKHVVVDFINADFHLSHIKQYSSYKHFFVNILF